MLARSGVHPVLFRPILHDRSWADDFQLRDSGQIVQNFFLYAVRQNSSLPDCIATIKWEHGYAFIRVAN